MAAEFDESWDEFLDAYQEIKNELAVYKSALQIFTEKYCSGDSQRAKKMRAEIDELLGDKTNGKG